MDTRIGATQPDVVTVSSEPRPTPSPTRFSEVLASGATSMVQGAEAAATVLPGNPLTALVVRGPVPTLPTPPVLAPPVPTLGGGLPPGPGLLPSPWIASMPGTSPFLAGGLPMPIAPSLSGMPASGGGLAAEGPGGGTPSAGAAVGSALAASLPGALMGDGGLQASLIQSQQMNMYYLQLQQTVDAENRTFSTLSNVLKAQNDTVKNAIGNIH